MNTTAKLLAGLFLTTAIASTAHAAPIQIDDFTAAQDVADAPIPGFLPNSSQAADAGAIGGFRDAQISASSSTFASGRFMTSGGAGELSSNAGVTSTLTLTWDGDDDPTTVDTAGLAGVDVTSGATNTKFSLDILAADLAGAVININLWDTSGATSSASSAALGIGASTVDLFFADFTGTTDMTDIGAIQLVINGVDDLDMSFDNFRVEGPLGPPPAVPLPAGLLLMLGGLGGIVTAARAGARRA